jgi:hypothetical protein
MLFHLSEPSKSICLPSPAQPDEKADSGSRLATLTQSFALSGLNVFQKNG